MKGFKYLAFAVAALAWAGAQAEEAATPPPAVTATPGEAVPPAAPPASATAPAETTPAEPAPVPPPSAPAGPYQGATLTSVTYVMPSMTKTSAGAAALGVLGALMTLGEGDKIVRAYGVTDAAIAISAALTPLVAAKYQTGSTVAAPGWNSNDTDDLAKLANHSGLVLDVETRQWMVGYFPFDWGHYKLQYGARARLIDAVTGKAIRKSTCYFTTADDENPPNDTRVVENDAAWLKDRLSKAADACVATFTKELVEP